MLALTGSAGALGLTTGLQFLPILLFSPIAGVLADRFSKRSVMMVTQIAMATTAAAARRPGHHRRRPGLARLRHRLRLRHRRGVRHPGPSGVRQRDGRPRQAHQRRRPQLGVVQPRPDDRTGGRRRRHRPARLRRRRQRLGDPAQQRDLSRRARRPQADAQRGAAPGASPAAGQGSAARRDRLRPVAAGHHARDGDPVRCGDVRLQLPDDHGADGHRRSTTRAPASTAFSARSSPSGR